MALSRNYKIFLFDNSPGSSFIPAEVLDNSNLFYFTFHKNAGIGAALRFMGSYAYNNDFDFLLYFDQDTIFSDLTLEYVENFLNLSIENRTFSFEGLFSITFRDGIIKNAAREGEISSTYFTIHRTDLTISSGTVFEIEKLKKIGWHDDSYFIDGVDYFICLLAQKNGFYVAEIFDTPGLDHKTDQGDISCKIFSKVIRARRYPAYRIKNYLISSVKLIAMATKMRSRTAIVLVRMLFLYIIVQLVMYLRTGLRKG